MKNDYEEEVVKGKYIKMLRTEKGLSQRKLALMANINHTDVNRIESEEIICPNIKTLKSIGEALDINYLILYYQFGYIDKEILDGIVTIDRVITVKENEKKLSDYSNKELLEELLRRENNI